MAEDKIEELELIVTEQSENIALTANSGKHKAGTNGYKTIIKVHNLNSDYFNIECFTKQNINLSTVTSINLSYCRLSSLPANFSAVEHLKQLNLSNNLFQKPPECLRSNLRFLEDIDLSFNLLTDFDTEPRCCLKLKSLNLAKNRITRVPEWILYVRSINLIEFNYSYNSVNYSLRESKFNKVFNYQLKKLEVVNCGLYSEDLDCIKSIRTLEYLNLSNDFYRGNHNAFRDLDVLFDKPKWACTLKVLHLRNEQISFLSENISTLENLKELYLQNNSMSWLPNSICSLHKLEVLDVSVNSIASLPENLTEMKNLTRLNISCNCLSAVPDLSGLTKLSYLDLYDNDIDDLVYSTLDFVELIDLEMNYFDTKDIEKYQEYVCKKDNLRKDISVMRCDGKKEFLQSTFEESSYSSLSSRSDDGFDDGLYKKDYEYDEESWDTVRSTNGDSGVTLSDDDWLGYEKYVPKKVVRKKLVSSPTYLFEDAD